MNTPFTEMKKSLHGRWKPQWSKEISLIPVARAFNTSLAAVEALARQAAVMRQGGKFSDQGLRDEIRALAIAETVPVLKKASEDMEQVRQSLAEQRAQLAIPKPDRSNAAEAIMRSEMRTWLRSLPQTQATQVLLSEGVDERMLQAAFEAPAVMSGLTDEVRNTVQDTVNQRKFGTEMARLDEIGKAVGEAEAALGVSLYQLRQEAMFEAHEDIPFDNWMRQGSVAAEAVEQAKPTDVMVSDFRAELDEIFAKGFPAAYPDHPVNRPAG